MPEKTWSAKRERQYQHIKEGLRAHGKSEDLAEEIAARTVNKERARRQNVLAALQRSEVARHQGPLRHDEGGAREGARALSQRITAVDARSPSGDTAAG
jgi:hypothetical protein